MAFSHRGGDRSQQFLLPPSLDDWLPQDHLARFVASTVDQLDLRAFARPHRIDGRGRRSFDPKMLVELVLLAWCEGVRSSRRIERCCIDHIAYRWITGNDGPDHTTISRFIKDQTDAIDGLFVQVLQLGFAAGMGQVGVVAIDGTKLAADASPLKSVTRQRLETEVRRIHAEHETNDAAEDEAYGEARGDELPADLADPATRDGRIVEALAQIEAEDAVAKAEYDAKVAAGQGKGGRSPKVPEPVERKANITDPDCRTMRSPRGFGPAYNAQAAVTEDQLILATDVTQDRTDNHQFTPMAAAAAQALNTLGVKPSRYVAADTGSWNPALFAQDRTDGADVLIPPLPNKSRKPLAPRGPIPAAATLSQRMERKLNTKPAKAAYAKRAVTAEPVFGQIKGARGITRFRRRGLNAAKSEWSLIATTHNILKMWRNDMQYA